MIPEPVFIRSARDGCGATEGSYHLTAVGLPKQIKLSIESGGNVGIATDENVLMVVASCTFRPIVAAGNAEVAIEDGEFVVHMAVTVEGDRNAGVDDSKNIRPSIFSLFVVGNDPNFEAPFVGPNDFLGDDIVRDGKYADIKSFLDITNQRLDSGRTIIPWTEEDLRVPGFHDLSPVVRDDMGDTI